jgi:Uma2 family endonuclease
LPEVGSAAAMVGMAATARDQESVDVLIIRAGLEGFGYHAAQARRHRRVVASPGIPDEGRFIPDAVFAPAELDVFHDAPSWMSVDGIELVLEVTSSRPELDRNAKRRAYAAAGIPLYLLVDRQQRRVTPFSHPVHDDYSRTSAAAFGDTLELPKPFDFTLDTAPFAN